MKKLLKNVIRCKHCGDVIESAHRYDFRTCSCKKVSVDGGLDYARRLGNKDDFQELSEWEDEESNENQ